MLKAWFLSAALTMSPADAAPENLVQVNGDDASSNSQTIVGMSYEEARGHILAAGWTPLENKNPDPDLRKFSAGDAYDQGFIEVDTCAPNGSIVCNFVFEGGGSFLKVQTEGDTPYVTGFEVLDHDPRVSFPGESAPVQGMNP